ncbi:hypothetical protein NX059_001483 [Plenodomus lindquistii]|nr:hypothetical protein NX059_001483 [Plenodomus lindquistii]
MPVWPSRRPITSPSPPPSSDASITRTALLPPVLVRKTSVASSSPSALVLHIFSQPPLRRRCLIPSLDPHSARSSCNRCPAHTSTRQPSPSTWPDDCCPRLDDSTASAATAQTPIAARHCFDVICAPAAGRPNPLQTARPDRAAPTTPRHPSHTAPASTTLHR